MTATRTAAPGTPAASPGQPASSGKKLSVTAVFAVSLIALAALGAVHLTQGTADLGVGELLRSVAGGDDSDATAILIASRLPRLGAAVLIGLALGVAGATLQSVARNPLASPDTLAVNSGAYLTVVAVASFGISLPFYLDGLTAFAGGLAAAGLVLLISRGGDGGPTRLVLAGSAIALALSSLSYVLLMLFQVQTQGLFAWQSGTTVQSGSQQVKLAIPLIALGVIGLLLLAHRLDVMALGDDSARVLGIDVRRSRMFAVLLAVLLAATAVTVTGPIGFVGLSAGVAARSAARRLPGLGRHVLLLPLAGIFGALVVTSADVLLRLFLPADVSIAIPTGVVTTLSGAVVLVWLARQLRGGAVGQGTRGAHGTVRSGRWVAGLWVVLVLALVGSLVAGLLLGQRVVLLGDVVNWVRDAAGTQVNFALSQRWPRVLAALAGGAALALAGAIVQAVCRNPLAEPGLLGVTPGASVGAVAVVVLLPGLGIWPMMGLATLSALLTFALVLWLAAGTRATGRGLSSERLVLIGIGVSSGAAAITTLIVVVVSPWDTNLALTWLSGSTYGRGTDQSIPVLVALAIGLPLTLFGSRTLDLIVLDEDMPRVLGVRLNAARLAFCALAAVLTAAAACAVGALGFVGLVAPHAARALAGGRHSRSVPVAVALGAVLVCLADTLGRYVIAPSEIAAGLVTAIIGAPYFVWLLHRSRTR
ncbi:iron ABC transporter permease [Kineosporia sp. NBRC 101731]|uniref:iron ABC transporter permease n=1 Tax=Kineosporia sp. NBRC 101731 TaxID=3032199 RepID=UPI0024A10E5C|nr:iron ABC transporter permease [Kineosporia sp. NBRC 101731]GLY32653.1 iron-hydroxamate transporter permease subunit [Kineosporia sp. NBRC 101731]